MASSAFARSADVVARAAATEAAAPAPIAGSVVWLTILLPAFPELHSQPYLAHRAESNARFSLL